jgi:hypothetical protein
MPRPLSRGADVVLRGSFWLAAAVLVVCAAEPTWLPDPRLELGDASDDTSAVIHWTPAALVVWMIVSSRLRKIGRTPPLTRALWSAPYPRRPDEA